MPGLATINRALGEDDEVTVSQPCPSEAQGTFIADNDNLIILGWWNSKLLMRCLMITLWP